jgi:hypothetical protein
MFKKFSTVIKFEVHYRGHKVPSTHLTYHEYIFLEILSSLLWVISSRNVWISFSPCSCHISFLKFRCNVQNRVHTRVEAGSNTSTVTLRVVGGDEKGSLKCETVKYGLKSQGTRTRERLRWQGPAAYTKDRPDLSSERVPHKNKAVTVTHVIKIWS